MKTKITTVIALAAAFGLLGCNTISGAGKDVSSAGKAVSKAAKPVN